MVEDDHDRVWEVPVDRAWWGPLSGDEQLGIVARFQQQLRDMETMQGTTVNTMHICASCLPGLAEKKDDNPKAEEDVRQAEGIDGAAGQGRVFLLPVTRRPPSSIESPSWWDGCAYLIRSFTRWTREPCKP